MLLTVVKRHLESHESRMMASSDHFAWWLDASSDGGEILRGFLRRANDALQSVKDFPKAPLPQP
jgi:hypothetical protein